MVESGVPLPDEVEDVMLVPEGGRAAVFSETFEPGVVCSAAGCRKLAPARGTAERTTERRGRRNMFFLEGG